MEGRNKSELLPETSMFLILHNVNRRTISYRNESIESDDSDEITDSFIKQEKNRFIPSENRSDEYYSDYTNKGDQTCIDSPELPRVKRAGKDKLVLSLSYTPIKIYLS